MRTSSADVSIDAYAQRFGLARRRALVGRVAGDGRRARDHGDRVRSGRPAHRQAGFHLPATDPRLPANLRLLPLPPYCPEINPVERFGGLLKAQVRNRLYPNLRKLEDHLAAAARRWTSPDKVAGLIHTWLADQVNSGAPA